MGALAAVGSVAGGAVVASAAMAAFQEGNFWENFANNFHTNFRIAAAILGLSVLAADIFGGGLTAAGGNGLNGWVQSKNVVHFPILDNNSFTVGSGTFLNGVKPSAIAVAGGPIGLHEFGHTLQYIGLSALGGLTKTGFAGSGGSYLVLGALGGTAYGTWWEKTASWLGGLF